MKHVLSKVCAASVAAAGLAAFTSAANAENRPLEFETEFDLGIDVAVAPAVPAANLIQAELATAVSAWEASIGEYLEQVVGAAKQAVADPAPAAQDDAVQAAVDAELSALAPPAPTISLAPYLSSDAHDCELCHAEGQWVEVTRVEQAAAPAEGLVDDAAAWEKLAEWASSRIDADETAAAEADGWDAFFSESSLAD